jgi:NitT/TauT family transport system permease protein
MLAASSRYQVPLVFAGLIVVAIMSIAMYAICAMVERRMTHWAVRA